MVQILISLILVQLYRAVALDMVEVEAEAVTGITTLQQAMVFWVEWARMELS